MIGFIIKNSPTRSIRKKLLEPAILFCLLVGFLFLPGTHFYLAQLGQSQSDQLGHLLVAQVAEKSRRSLLNGDTISLQVIVNDVVTDNPLTLGAAIYDSENILQAQSRTDSLREDSTMSAYRQPIAQGNFIAGHVLLSLDSQKLNRGLNKLFWVAFFAWLALSSLLCTGIYLVSKRLSQRLLNIISGLPYRPLSAELKSNDWRSSDLKPADSISIKHDEISQLEFTIKPLLVKPQNRAKNALDNSSYTLTMNVENIASLQAQLTRENLGVVLTNFDLILNITATLFDAKRLPGSQHHVHFSFDYDGDKHNALMRAICFNMAINRLLISNESTGAAIILCSALGSGPEPISEALTEPENCQFLQDQRYELTLHKLAEITALADPWQLLIQASLVEDATNLPFDYQILENATDLVLLLSLNDEYQTTLSDQLSYLNNQLQKSDSASISEVAS